MEVQETIVCESGRGPVELEIHRLAEARIANAVQVNCFMPPSGAGFFVVFPADQEAAAVEAAAALAGRDDLQEGANITGEVPGCLCAGTVPRPTVQFGTPKVSHAY